jgi:hypothetical protein
MSLASGCGAPVEKLIRVIGKVTVDGKPWTIGDVGYFPDASRGNTIGRASIGVIGSDGTYEIHTAGKRGAPLGWYKVVVWATKDPAAAGNPWGPDGKRRSIQWLIDPQFTSEESTPLTKEVIEQPSAGHYDLPLTR